MKLTIERAALLKALGHVQSVVERRTTIPILSNVLLRAEAGRLALSATDMDLEIVERVPARVERDGRTTAPAHTLYDIVRKLREGAQVELEAPGGKERDDAALGPLDLYPRLPAARGLPGHVGRRIAAQFRAVGGELRSLIDRTRFAISTEETRYYLNGIYPARDQEQRGAGGARGRDRRAPPGPRRDHRCPKARPGCRASSCRARPCSSSESWSMRARPRRRSRSRWARPRSAVRSARRR